MDSARIAELLQPFGCGLSAAQLQDISTYINLLLKWNARMNLTAVRAPEEIVRRHFGESLFAARHLFPEGSTATSVIDVGSGAGFPGLPIKIWNPEAHLTLIESNQRKATFLKEVVRALTLMNVDVLNERAQQYSGPKAALVTLRAVEKFNEVLPATIALAAEAGEVALLIGERQVAEAKRHTDVRWGIPISMPLSEGRVLLVGRCCCGQ